MHDTPRSDRKDSGRTLREPVADRDQRGDPEIHGDRHKDDRRGIIRHEPKEQECERKNYDRADCKAA